MYGKLIGAMVGGSAGMLLAWSPLLACTLATIGGIIGHYLIDQEPDVPRVLRAEWPERPRPHAVKNALPKPVTVLPDQSFIDALAPLFIELARVDGPVSRLEVRVVREFFEGPCKLDPVSMDAVRVALKAALANSVQELDVVAKRAFAEVRPALKTEVIRWLYDLALVDGPLTNSETNGLKHIVEAFELTDAQKQQVAKQFLGSGAAHFLTLGLPETASDDEIRSAFRRLATENHPDKTPGEAAASRFREVKEAYEALKRIRGF